MAVTLKDDTGRYGRPGSVVTLDAAVDRYSVVARSADAELEDRAGDAIEYLEDDAGEFGPDVPDPVGLVAAFLVDLGLTIVADTTPADPTWGLSPQEAVGAIF